MHRTPLHNEHFRLKARMIAFGGWEMPVLYEGIIAEHRACRTAAGLFDLCHMARIRLTGADRLAFLDALSPNRLTNLPPGRARYTFFCREDGGIIDDLIVYCLEDRILVIANAVNREAVLAWMKGHAGGFDVTIEDLTFQTGMISLQGPRSEDVLSAFGVTDLADVGYFHHRREDVLGAHMLFLRTGYTGEDGFEMVAPAEIIVDLWRKFLAAGRPFGLAPVGLGARDTLRLEACLPLYGHELSLETNPVHAGLSRFVKTKDRDFVGKAAILAAQRSEDPDDPRLAGLVLEGRRIPRQGQEVLSGGRVVGKITSGTFSPTLEKSIALGYVPVTLASPGTKLAIRVSRADVPAEVAAIPFYSRRS
jgi:aminomethyltransferase